MSKTRNDFLNLIPKQAICCEIGVFRGDYSKIMYNICQPKKLFLVDIFQGKGCSGDKDGLNMVYTDNLNDYYEHLADYFKNDPNVTIIKSDSHNFLNNASDNYFDFIYVDGDHLFDGVYNDLLISYKKLKSGGILAGHDYHESIGDVKKAVDQFCFENNLILQTTTEDLLPTFWVYKN